MTQIGLYAIGTSTTLESNKSLAPLQDMLEGAIPPPCRVGRLLKLSTYLPLTFHGRLPDEKSQREHKGLSGDGTYRIFETRTV
jgi:hypothetical protein